MSQLYSRVFVQILDSSIAEDWHTRHVFEDFLKLASSEGIVDITRQAFARRTNTPIDIMEAAIAKLEGPDAASRDVGNEGRRLIRLDQHRDWGWMIANWDKFSAIRRRQDQLDAECERKRSYREAKRSNPPTPPSEDSTSTSIPTAIETGCPGHVRTTPDKMNSLFDIEASFPSFWAEYPRKEAKQPALKAWKRTFTGSSLNHPALFTDIINGLHLHKQSSQWHDTKFIPHASTWLNQRRWEETPIVPAPSSQSVAAPDGTKDYSGPVW